MASKNSIKLDIKDGYYHVYNRGVEKRTIFEDEMDYKVFLNYLKEYLSPKVDRDKMIRKISFKDTVFKGMPRIPNNYNDKVELLVYCLMPNHFHLLIKQHKNGGMKEFLHSLLLRYSAYFNKKYGRIGPLFQGRYKAVSVGSDAYLLHLSRYIHLNSLEISVDLTQAFSSYPDYIGLRNTSWLNPKIVLDYFRNGWSKDFKKVNSYKDFVEKYNGNESLEGLVLD